MSNLKLLPRTSAITRLIQASVVSLACLAAPAAAHPPAVPAPRNDSAAEARIHIPPGFERQGKPQIYSRDDVARVHVTIIERSTGRSAFCRVNVVGADGNFYQPRDNPLANWSLERAGNRIGKGPFRYYGWFFYTPGSFDVEVPPGSTRIEVWKGFEYTPITHSIQLAAGAKQDLQLSIERTAPLAQLGYYSGDTHIHLPRGDATDDAWALDLIEAEDLQFGFLLSANNGKSYSGIMDRQTTAPQRALGPDSVSRRGAYEIASGQEYVTSSYGHLGMLMHKKMVLEGLTVDVNRWPLLGMIGQETRKLDGYSIHLHGGYANEIYIDFAQAATDGVELLQFAEYRGIELEGWYRMLNVGYRFPALGASDYPVCRVLGDCRTYVHSDARPSTLEWVRRATSGHSFFTTGPLILLEVDGRRPGDVISRQASDSAPLRARVRVRSLVAPVSEVELVVNGRSLARRQMPTDSASEWFEFDEPIAVQVPLWIAARCRSNSPPGQPDAEAHTNPVFVTVDGRLPYQEADLDWLVAKIDELSAGLKRRKFEEQAAALEYYRASRAALLEVRKNQGRRLSSQNQQTR